MDEMHLPQIICDYEIGVFIYDDFLFLDVAGAVLSDDLAQQRGAVLFALRGLKFSEIQVPEEDGSFFLWID